MRAPGLGWLLGVAALAVGCSTLTPSQDRSLGEVRDFAEETSRRYQLPPIHVLVSHNPDSPVGAYRRGFFAVNELVLASEYRDAIVAHELAHYVLGHDQPLGASSARSRQREREQRELDANAKSVEILVWVRAVPEDQALLHARAVVLPHPIDGWRVGISAPLPGVRRTVFERLLGAMPEGG